MWVFINTISFYDNLISYLSVTNHDVSPIYNKNMSQIVYQDREWTDSYVSLNLTRDKITYNLGNKFIQE